MKISTKGRYGVRIMLELALHFDKDLLTVRAISQKQGISEKYIEQIISTLNKAGLVRSQRGAAGGYRLAEPPHAITVGQILNITEGGFSFVECLGHNSTQCDRRDECVTSDVWQEITDAIEAVVYNITLANLVTRYYEKSNYVYMI